MQTYIAKFYGRKKGAIGAFEHITTTTRGLDKQSATIALYDRYENIHQLTLTEILQ